MSLPAEPILFAQAFLQARATGTALEGVAVRVGRAEDSDQPPFLLLEQAGEIHDRGLPAYLPARVSVTAFGLDEDQAILLYRAASDLFHRVGPVVIDGVGMWKAFDETGPQPREETNTNWSARYGVIAIYMADVRLN